MKYPVAIFIFMNIKYKSRLDEKLGCILRRLDKNKEVNKFYCCMTNKLQKCIVVVINLIYSTGYIIGQIILMVIYRPIFPYLYIKRDKELGSRFDILFLHYSSK
ncbi:hypothetical protein BDA99DRAFT_531668 [Phascolomyces articulosus]|uniref:Uncharacterized protein n=1 Tax=Phascolomyces articulosus TaxID=60185 RepID=A0AAD5L0T5_9FUNG|nr:hypothetical protein BDA99DRAFT_531668 [Phascolomyces articulosus]